MKESKRGNTDNTNPLEDSLRNNVSIGGQKAHKCHDNSFIILRFQCQLDEG